MKKKILSIVFALFFLTFLGIMMYPFASQLINQIDQTDVTLSHEEAEDNLTDEQRAALRAEAESYNAMLAERAELSLNMPFEDAAAEDEVYMGLLNIKGDGIMAAIEIPKIDVRIPIYHGTAEAVLQQGAGHLEGSSLPVGGAGTHTVLSAHRGLPNKRFFTDLDQVGEGDIFLIRILGEVMAYQVDQVQTVLPDEVEPLKIRDGEDLATLITCTPYGINTHRIYVHGYRIPYEEVQEVLNNLDAMKGFWARYWWLVVTIVLLIWMAFLLYWFNKKPKPKEEENPAAKPGNVKEGEG